jgi:hypothetical protein
MSRCVRGHEAIKAALDILLTWTSGACTCPCCGPFMGCAGKHGFTFWWSVPPCTSGPPGRPPLARRQILDGPDVQGDTRQRSCALVLILLLYGEYYGTAVIHDTRLCPLLCFPLQMYLAAGRGARTCSDNTLQRLCLTTCGGCECDGVMLRRCWNHAWCRTWTVPEAGGMPEIRGGTSLGKLSGSGDEGYEGVREKRESCGVRGRA